MGEAPETDDYNTLGGHRVPSGEKEVEQSLIQDMRTASDIPLSRERAGL
jgi:hypothetical protein